MSEPINQLTLQADADTVWALAEFVKRTRWDTCGSAQQTSMKPIRSMPVLKPAGSPGRKRASLQGKPMSQGTVVIVRSSVKVMDCRLIREIGPESSLHPVQSEEATEAFHALARRPRGGRADVAPLHMNPQRVVRSHAWSFQ
jgi:hypothetical protein